MLLWNYDSKLNLDISEITMSHTRITRIMIVESSLADKTNEPELKSQKKSFETFICNLIQKIQKVSPTSNK